MRILSSVVVAIALVGVLAKAQETDPITQFRTPNGNGVAIRMPKPDPNEPRLTSPPSPGESEPPIAVTREESLQMLERLAALQERSALILRGPLLSPDGRLSQRFRALFELSVRDGSAIDTLFARAKLQVEATQLKGASFQPASQADELVIQFPAFPEAGGRIYDELLRGIDGVLGAERTRFLTKFAGSTLEQVCHGFGVQSRTLRLTRVREVSGITYHMVDESCVPGNTQDGNRSPGFTSSREGVYPTRSELLTELGAPVARLVPADF